MNELLCRAVSSNAWAMKDVLQEISKKLECVELQQVMGGIRMGWRAPLGVRGKVANGGDMWEIQRLFWWW